VLTRKYVVEELTWKHVIFPSLWKNQNQK